MKNQKHFIVNKLSSVLFVLLLVSSQIIFCSNTYSQNTDSLIHLIIDETSLDSLSNTVEILSGKKELILNDTSIVIKSRFADQPGNNIAADYIKNKLESWDLDTYDQQYSSSGRNIYAVQEGDLYPDKFYIICAHYDSMPEGPIAPGADDNASGVANVLEAARIIRNFNTAYSVIYALWDEEEIGHLGSTYFAEQAAFSNMDILGVLNIDMIGYHTHPDNVFEIHLIWRQGLWLGEAIVEVNSYYNINMTPHIILRGIRYSDHFSFYVNGYDAILYMENWRGWDGNQWWHTVNDRWEYLNLEYFHGLSKVSIATLAALGFGQIVLDVDSNDEISELNEFSLDQNYPNPFNPTTKIRYQIPELSFITIRVYNALGSEVTTLVNEEKPAGNYEIEFDGSDLPSGVYLYKLQTGSFRQVKKMLLIR